MKEFSERNQGCILALDVQADDNRFVAVGDRIYLVMPDCTVAVHNRRELTRVLRAYGYLDPHKTMTEEFYGGFQTDADEISDCIDDLLDGKDDPRLNLARSGDAGAKEVLHDLFCVENK